MIASDREPRDLSGGPLRQHLGDDSQADKNDGATECRKADQRMKGKADREVKRQPGQIKQRARAHSGKKAANTVDVGKRLRWGDCFMKEVFEKGEVLYEAGHA